MGSKAQCMAHATDTNMPSPSQFMLFFDLRITPAKVHICNFVAKQKLSALQIAKQRKMLITFAPQFVLCAIKRWLATAFSFLCW